MPHPAKRAGLDPCPVEEVLNLIGGKWKARILLLVSLRYETFGELRRALPRISAHVLSTQLKSMVDDALLLRVTRPVDAHRGVVPGARYALAPLARDLMPVLDIACAWGVRRLAARGESWTPPPPQDTRNQRHGRLA